MKIATKIYCLLIFLAFINNTVFPVSAIAIGVSETKIGFGVMNPGENATLTFTVTNMCSDPINVVIRIEGECPNWFSVSSYNFDLSGYESKSINLTVNIPNLDDPEPGDHFAHIVVVGFPKEMEEGETQIRIGTGIKLSTWVRLPGEVIKSGEILSFNAPDVEQGSMEVFEALFKPTGNVHLHTRLNVTISQGDKIIDVVEGGEVIVMRDDVKKLTANWNTSELPLGEYRATARIYYDGYSTGEITDSFIIGVRTYDLSFNVLDVCKGVKSNFEIIFRNKGTIATNARAFMIIKDSQGNIVERFVTPYTKVNPGEEYTFTFEWDAEDVSPGDYIATAAVQYDGKITAEKMAVFEVYEKPLLYIVAAILAAITIAVVIAKKIRRS